MFSLTNMQHCRCKVSIKQSSSGERAIKWDSRLYEAEITADRIPVARRAPLSKKIKKEMYLWDATDKHVAT
jgi:hypothetical protein